MSLESLVRYDIETGKFRLALHTLTLKPNEDWSWILAHYYVANDPRPIPTALGEGNDLVTSTIYYRVNENWGLRASHYFNLRVGRMQEQDYTIYRDLRSWTAALTARLRDDGTGPKDFTVAFTFSLKAFPRFGLGGDTIHPYFLLGS
jgi:hypothetical protein